MAPSKASPLQNIFLGFKSLYPCQLEPTHNPKSHPPECPESPDHDNAILARVKTPKIKSVCFVMLLVTHNSADENHRDGQVK